MKKKLRLMMVDDFDEEANAMAVCMAVLKPLCFDATWRVLHYVVVRALGRTWSIAKPQCDEIVNGAIRR